MFRVVTSNEIGRACGGAVVIDVMRAFTVTAWAFHLGAERIVLLRELDEALALKARTPGSLAFQDGAPLPGFDLANSPVQIERLDLRGRSRVPADCCRNAGSERGRAMPASAMYGIRHGPGDGRLPAAT